MARKELERLAALRRQKIHRWLDKIDSTTTFTVSDIRKDLEEYTHVQIAGTMSGMSRCGHVEMVEYVKSKGGGFTAIYKKVNRMDPDSFPLGVITEGVWAPLFAKPKPIDSSVKLRVIKEWR